MNTELILKIAGIGILVAVSCQILNKTGRDEQATLVTVAGIVIALLLLVGEIGGLFDTVKSIFGL
ncbi:MAG: stage III sporulation protein AC [Clostridiales bacterium]|nr:stage III sporulation protein AC [Clostridiales bacterium]